MPERPSSTAAPVRMLSPAQAGLDCPDDRARHRSAVQLSRGIFIAVRPAARVQHDTEEWQTATEVLLLVAQRNGPEMLARIAVMAEPASAEGAPAPRQNPARVFRIVR
jgi:hypothetical protein